MRGIGEGGPRGLTTVEEGTAEEEGAEAAPGTPTMQSLKAKMEFEGAASGTAAPSTPTGAGMMAEAVTPEGPPAEVAAEEKAKTGRRTAALPEKPATWGHNALGLTREACEKLARNMGEVHASLEDWGEAVKQGKRLAEERQARQSDFTVRTDWGLVIVPHISLEGRTTAEFKKEIQVSG